MLSSSEIPVRAFLPLPWTPAANRSFDLAKTNPNPSCQIEPIWDVDPMADVSEMRRVPGMATLLPRPRTQRRAIATAGLPKHGCRPMCCVACERWPLLQVRPRPLSALAAMELRLGARNASAESSGVPDYAWRYDMGCLRYFRSAGAASHGKRPWHTLGAMARYRTMEFPSDGGIF